jgi:Raf kinase inhibitor-like YbhB/YbcL family protein
MIRAEKSIALTSPAFANGNPIPSTYARFDAHPRGLNYSPPLSWINLPAGTKSLALICTDPDGNNWIHWVLYNIPPDINHLNEKLPQNPVLSNHSRQGKNSWGLIGYDGPAPPPGTGIHHYYFKLYVLDTILNLPAGVTASQLLSAMKSHLLGQGELMGTYQYLK